MQGRSIRRAALAALALGAAALDAGPAQATVRYELQSQVYRDVLADRYGYNPCGPEACRFPTQVDFTVSDAAIARGGISVQGSSSDGRDPTSVSGDVDDLINLRVALDNPVLARDFRGRFALRASFALDRSVTAFDLYYRGDAGDLRLLSISGNLVSGDLASDRFQVCSIGSCFITGRIEVFEPASMALLGFGLFGLAAIRRRG